MNVVNGLLERCTANTIDQKYCLQHSFDCDLTPQSKQMFYDVERIYEMQSGSVYMHPHTI